MFSLFFLLFYGSISAPIVSAGCTAFWSVAAPRRRFLYALYTRARAMSIGLREILKIFSKLFCGAYDTRRARCVRVYPKDARHFGGRFRAPVGGGSRFLVQISGGGCGSWFAVFPFLVRSRTAPRGWISGGNGARGFCVFGAGRGSWYLPICPRGK